MPYLEPEPYRPEPPLRAQITGPLAWEDPSLSWPRRLFSTLAATFMPLRTIHAVADGKLAPALVFALVSAVPFMMLWAVIPYTHTMRFDPSFRAVMLGTPTTLDLTLDIARAFGIGVLLSLLTLLSWAIPFASLVRAFSNGSRPESPMLAAWRTALYRTWIMPLGMTLLFVIGWGIPKDPDPVVIEIAFLSLQILPRCLILVHCHTMARYFGATGFGALVVSVVPLAVQWAAGLSVQQGAEFLLPPMPPS